MACGRIGRGRHGAARAYLAEADYDLIVLDVMIPGEDGLSILRSLNRKSGLAVILLSAIGEDVDRIVRLEMGANDYLAKPANPHELLARVRAVLRPRAGGTGAGQQTCRARLPRLCRLETRRSRPPADRSRRCRHQPVGRRVPPVAGAGQASAPRAPPRPARGAKRRRRFMFMCIQPLAGALSDRIGRKPLMLAELGDRPDYTSINAVVKAELFPTHIRTLSVTPPYAPANAIVGGRRNISPCGSKARDTSAASIGYVTAMIGVSLIIYLRMRDTQVRSKIRED